MKVKNFIYILCIAIITVAFGLNIYIAASNYGMKGTALISAYGTNPNGGSSSGSNGTSNSTNGDYAYSYMLQRDGNTTNGRSAAQIEADLKIMKNAVSGSLKGWMTIISFLSSYSCHHVNDNKVKCDQKKQKEVFQIEAPFDNEVWEYYWYTGQVVKIID